MAITPYSVQLIARAAGSGKAASLGYPDLLLSQGQIISLIGGKAYDLPTREDSEQILSWHKSNLPVIYDSSEFFKRMGYDLEVFDLKQIRGDETFIDLNNPLWPQYRQEYDLVLDPGTCEHCFHMGQAIMNVADMCKVGGHIVQGFPLNAYNHGFYNVSPTLIPDFYEDNGFDVIKAFGVAGGETFSFDYFKRVREYPANAFMLLLVKRLTDQKLTVPVQRKYREILN